MLWWTQTVGMPPPEREVRREVQAVDVHQVGCARAQDLLHARAERYRFVHEVGVHAAAEHAAEVIPDVADAAVVLAQGEGLHCAEAAECGDSSLDVVFPARARGAATLEAQCRRVEASGEEAQHVVTANPDAPVRGIRERLAQEEQSGALAHGNAPRADTAAGGRGRRGNAGFRITYTSAWDRAIESPLAIPEPCGCHGRRTPAESPDRERLRAP